jgi:hypothetical protein
MTLADTDRFLLLAASLPPRQRHYLILRGMGYDHGDAAGEVGVKPETIESTWAWGRDNSRTFREARELLVHNPRFAELLLDEDIRKQAKIAMHQEISSKRFRADVLRLAAEASGLVNQQPHQTAPPIIAAMQALLPVFAQSIAEQQQKLLQQEPVEVKTVLEVEPDELTGK